RRRGLRRLRLLAISVLLTSTCIAGSVHAAALFSQPVTPNGGVYSNPAQIIADDFAIPGGGAINQVIWYGNAFANPPVGPMSVVFYANTGSGPGAILANNPVTPTIVDTGQTNVFFGGQEIREIFQFTADIPTFNTAGGVSYFLSVEETSGGPNFVWVNSNASPVAWGSFTGGASWIQAPSAAAYTLLSTPILPVSITADGGFAFDVPVVGDIPIFIDPAVAVGYHYAVGAGNPLFADVTLPTGIGDSMYTLSFDGQSFTLAGGVNFDFTKYFTGGVEAFDVTGIETSAGLDPRNTSAFPTELTFVASGDFTGTMTPITLTVPEPTTLVLLSIGLVVFAIPRRREGTTVTRNA
ncbi:MAG: PEP-CTERM sorting domain-containing protein, partial [Terriglobales bacterium]